MDEVKIGGLRIAFERKGEGAPIVLLHGALSDSREWRRQLDELCDEFTVVAWDGTWLWPLRGSTGDIPFA